MVVLGRVAAKASAAGDIDDPPAVVRLELQHRLAAKVGTVQRCLVDAIDGELAIARSMADAPEIDGLVQIQDGREAGLVPGEFVNVRIMGSDEHDLYGEVEYND